MPQKGPFPRAGQNTAAAALQAKFMEARALFQQGKFADSERKLREILRQQPNNFEALLVLGIIAAQTRKTEQAVDLIGRAIKLKPDVAEAYVNLGNAQMELNRPAEALVNFDKAIALKPNFSEAYNNLGNAFMDLGRPAEALPNFDRAIACRADYAEAHANRGAALMELGRPEDALASLDRAIAFKPDYATAHGNRGVVLMTLNRPEEALASYDRSIALKPDVATVHSNRGTALRDLGRPQEGLASCNRAIGLDPNFAAGYLNLGNTLRDLKLMTDAQTAYNKAIALKPDYADAYWNQSLLLLSRGDFEQGWKLFEWRWKSVLQDLKREFPQPLWLGGEPLAGKAIFLYGEQGLGDSIQFCRYAKMVADLGARVILEVPKPLVSLLCGLAGVSELVEWGAPLPAFDFQCPLLSLPLAFNTTVSTIPANVPYLTADVAKSRYWREKLGETSKLRVGLVWAGGFRPDQPELWSLNKRRNIPLAQLAPLKHSGIEFFSLQKGQPAESDLAALMRQNWDGPRLIDFTNELHDFSDTAALIDNLDLIISVDTSIAHLAGALAKPVWILNRYDIDWRWLTDRDDSPWYPTATLFTQQQIGDWAGVVRNVKNALWGLFDNTA